MKTNKKKIGLGVGAVVVILAIGFAVHSYLYVSTDNAMVEAKTTLLSPRVGGLIVSSDVEDNQVVKAGQVLAKIRRVEFENSLQQAEADRDSIAAQLRNAQSSFERAEKLYKQGATTQEKLDSAEAGYKSMAQKLRMASSQVEQAQTNLEDTIIRAPTDGKIAKKSFEVGMMVAPGQPIVGFVEGDDRWATANFKETELVGINPGAHAEIEVDAIPGKKFLGVVESLSPSTGAIFSLLPPDNATGNFTKVVQRVPVRVRFMNLSQSDLLVLQAGLSAEVSVKVH